MLTEVRKALVLDPDNQMAQDWLIRLEQKAARDKAEPPTPWMISKR